MSWKPYGESSSSTPLRGNRLRLYTAYYYSMYVRARDESSSEGVGLMDIIIVIIIIIVSCKVGCRLPDNQLYV